jgi:uncharacterized protein YdeI (YjbR/CyaY-like superfamily)
MSAYDQRPAHQQNDYLAWIKRAKQETTRGAGLAQMLEELEGGDRYMMMERRTSASGPVSGRGTKHRSRR